MEARNREQVIRQLCGIPGDKVRFGKMWPFAAWHFQLILVLKIGLNFMTI